MFLVPNFQCLVKAYRSIGKPSQIMYDTLKILFWHNELKCKTFLN